MVSPPTEVGLVFESLEARSRVAQLEAEIAQLKDALARRQQIGVATGLLGPALRPSPRAGLVTAGTPLPKTAMSRYATSLRPSSTRTAVDSAQAEVEILSVIEMHMPDVRLMGARVAGQEPTSESSQ